MEKYIKSTNSGMVRAEYIEVEPNLRLHITDAGNGRPVVLIHGWPLSDEMFEYQYHALTKNNFRAIGITLRGFGKSDKPYEDYNYDTHAMDIETILSKLDIKDAVLVGFSMGGSIAIRYVSLYKGARISKLVLCGAAAPRWTQCEDFRYNLSASSYATGECLIALRDTDLRPDLAKIAIPTLIIHGKKDKICSFDLAEQMKAGIKNAHIVPFENSGHSMFLEETPRFNAELIKFAKN